MLKSLNGQFESSFKTLFTSIIVVLIVWLLNKKILPAYKSLKNQIHLSKISNTSRGHWLHGHLKEVCSFYKLRRLLFLSKYSNCINFQKQNMTKI